MSSDNGNGHGGRRNGSGRKAGGSNLRTREARAFAEQARDQGVTPLDAMLQCMRKHHAAGDLDRAAEVGRWCAPYLHPRLSSVDVAASLTAPPPPIQFIEVVRDRPRADDE
jgi:hypothetical protein